MSSVSIIIPNYNGEKVLANCINSIINQRGACFEIIVIDNGSEDNSIDYIKNKYDRLIIRELGKNHGFSAAVNIGIKEATGDYIAVLNNDTELSPDWVENVIHAFKQNPEVMFVTSKICSLVNKDLLDDVGDIILPSGKVYKLGNNEKDSGQYDHQRQVFGASGCASVFRRGFFEKVGFFDEDFFAYLEDIDLSFRANLFGFRCNYVPDAVVYHIGSSTTGSKYNKFTVFHHAQNTINLIVKNFPLKSMIRYMPGIVWYIAGMQAYFLTRGLGWAFFKGILSGIWMIKKMLPKRRDIMKIRVLSDSDLTGIFKANKRAYLTSRKQRVSG